MDQRPAPHEEASARILREYQEAGRWFDGIHQMLLPHLRENRRADPGTTPSGRLATDIGRLGFTDYRRPVISRPNFVIDGGVLLSYARLDNSTVGAALVEAVHDGACQVIVSGLAYLRIAPELLGTTGERRIRRLLGHPASVPDVTFREVDIIARLDAGEPLDVMHTALLALRHRCVIGTLNPALYHRIGYPRTLDLSP